MTPDQICSSAVEKKLKIKIEYKKDFILLEGNKEELLFLAKLIESQACFDKDQGFQLIIDGSGKKLIKKGSNISLYINRKDE